MEQQHITSGSRNSKAENAIPKAVDLQHYIIAIGASAGGLEAIFTVLALRDQIAPPTLNFENPDANADGIDIVAGSARPMPMQHAITNGFGFGGVNASAIFRRMG